MSDPTEGLRRRALPHLPVLLPDLQSSPDETMVEVCARLTEAVNCLITESHWQNLKLEKVRISWHNILNLDYNPDGLVGNIRIVGEGKDHE